MGIMEQVYWGNPLSAWATALAVAAGTVVLLALIRGVLSRRLRAVAARTSTDIDDALAEIVRSTGMLFMLGVAVKIASGFLALPEATHHALTMVLTLVLILQGGIWGNTLIVFWFTRTMKERMTGDLAGTTSLTLLKYLVRVVLWTILLLVALDSVGVNITAFITTLGVGGIAIALALQNILGDLFASLSIVLDKPFVVGDAINVGDHTGTVERIGIKSTRIRSIGGEEVTIPNSELSNSRIRNFVRMEERRVLFTLAVSYRTPSDVVERIPAMIAGIVAGVPGTRFERAHFLKFSDYALTVEVVFYARTADYIEYARIHQEVNFAILRSFRQHNIEFASPAQTVRLER